MSQGDYLGARPGEAGKDSAGAAGPALRLRQGCLAAPMIVLLISSCDLCESPLTGHSEGAERPKNLMNTRKYEILCYAQDDKMVIRRGLKLRATVYK
jgi:hypothetical protein